jgi:glycosyltransferase involved in cell wall biosynthesis
MEAEVMKKTQHTQPLVSVLMPVYNGSVFVAEAIDSILNQSYQNLELIIVDDKSTDDTVSILKKYQKKYPKKIKTVFLKKNQGSTYATNTAFKLSKGEFIAIMDSDDISHPKRLEKQVAFLSKKPDVIVVGGQAKVIDKTGSIVGEKTFPLTHAEIYRAYGQVHPIVHPSIMIRRSLLPTQRYLYQDKHGIHDDYFNLFRLLQYGKFANLPTYLVYYRMHGNNNSLKALKKSYWTILKIRIEAWLKLNYSFSIVPFTLMIVQTMIVLLLPETLLKKLYFSVKGIALNK